MSPVLGLTFIAQHEICGSSKGRVTELLEDTAKRRALAVQENGGFCFFGGLCLVTEGACRGSPAQRLCGRREGCGAFQYMCMLVCMLSIFLSYIHSQL